MNLTNELKKIFSNSFVGEEKIAYLLELLETNLQRNSKAKFFESFGFSLGNPNQFVDFIRTHPSTARLIKSEETEWGQKFVFSCNIKTPSGNKVCIKSVWYIDKGKNFPRLITAYPEK